MKSYSFIIPVYNCEKYIQSSVENIVKIDLDDYEVILVDDGSKDASGNICDQLANKYTLVKVIHQVNQGVSAARNHGIDVATKDYIVFQDADDSIDVNELVILIKDIEELNCDLSIFGLCFDYYYKGKNYRRDNMVYPLKGVMTEQEWINHFNELYQCNYLSPIWNKVYKRNILHDHQIKYREDMFLYEDLEFVFHYMSCCKDIYLSNQVIYYYRQTEDEGNAKRRLLRINNITDLVNQIEQSLDYIIQEKSIHESNLIFDIKKILAPIYLILANEKIAVSDKNGVIKICNDMKDWYDIQSKEIKELFSSERAKLILNCDYKQLMKQAKISAIRHKVANFVKFYIGDFRKWMH